MPVNITNEELDLFNKNGFSDDDVRATVENYRSQGLDDNAIRAKIDTRLQGWNTPQKQTTQNAPQPLKIDNEEYQADIDAAAKEAAAEFGAIPEKTETKTITGGVERNIRQELDSKGRVHYFDENGNEINNKLPLMQRIGRGIKAKFTPQYKPIDEKTKDAWQVAKFLGGLATRSPQGFAAVEGLGSFVDDYLEGNKPNVGRAAATGALTYGGAKGLELGIKTPLAQKAIQKGGEIVSERVLPAIKKGGENLKPLIKKGGEFIQNLRKKPQVTQEAVQAAEEAATRPPTVQETQEIKKAIKTSIKLDKLPETNKNNGYYVNHRHKGNYFRTVADPLALELENTSRKVNEGIKKLAKDPEFMNSKEFADLDAEIAKQIDKLPKEAQTEFYNTWYGAQAKADNYIKLGSEFKPQGLEQSVLEAKGTPREVKQILKNDMPQYQVLHNNELTEQAVKEVEGNFNNELSRLTGAKEFDALDYEKSRQITKRLFDEGRVEEAINLIDNVSENATKKGQAIQALSLWSNMTPEGAVFKAQKMVREVNKKLSENKRIKLTDKQIQDIRDLGGAIQKTEKGTRENEIAIAKMNKYVTDLMPKSWQKKYDTFRYINMLLSPKSRNKDFILTGVNAADTAVDETIANGIDFLRSLLPGQQKAFGGLQPKAWFKGAKKGFKEGVEDIKLGINTSRSGETGRYGTAKTNNFEYTPWSQIEKSPKGILQAGENILATGEKGLNYTLQVPDRVFYESRFASSLESQMKAAGINNPTPEMLEQAHKEALEAVYQDNSWVSKLGNGIRDLADSSSAHIEDFLHLPENSVPRVGGFLAPFVKTPANIINMGIKNTAGGVLGIPKLLAAKSPQEIRDAEMLIAKNIKGAVPIGLGIGIGTGKINSNIGDEDYQDNEVTGLKPQSIVIGDKAISLQNYPQWSIPMAAGAGYVQGGLPQAAANTVSAIGDMSSLKAVGDFINSFKPSYPGEEVTPAQIANNIARTQGVNILSQNIPFGGWLGEIRNDIDPYAREMYMPKGETPKEMVENTINYTKNRLQNRIPGASRLLPKKYNALGEPVMINNIQNPAARVASEALDFGVRNYNNPPAVYDELKDFKEKIKDTKIDGKTKVGLQKPSRTVEVNGEKIKLDNKQYSAFSHDYTKINYLLKDLAINDDEYKNMEDEDKAKYLNELRKSVDEAVRIIQFNHQPSRKYHEFTQYILDNYDELTAD